MNTKEQFKNKLYLKSKTPPQEFNTNLTIEKAKEVLYKFYPQANMIFENIVIDYFKLLVDCNALKNYLDDCIDKYNKNS